MSATPADARISLATLGVADIARSVLFYEAMGWRHAPEAGGEAVAFMAGRGIALSLFGTRDLADDAHLPAELPLPGFRGMALALNLASPADVDRVFAAALDAGATATKLPQPVFWGGYSGYFTDPDGHLWELAHNPFFVLDGEGRIDLFRKPEETA